MLLADFSYTIGCTYYIFFHSISIGPAHALYLTYVFTQTILPMLQWQNHSEEEQLIDEHACSSRSSSPVRDFHSLFPTTNSERDIQRLNKYIGTLYPYHKHILRRTVREKALSHIQYTGKYFHDL